ncbi:MAG: SH3 domain-containing protein [Clostridia bacterium]|nr:SH3 domain-containing protein [Clostridia bacterium]
MKQMKKILAALLIAAICLSMVAALAESGTVYTTGNVNMRKGPGLDYSSIRAISADNKLEYDKTAKDERGVKWYRVSYKGRTGWISSKYVAGSKNSGGSGSSSSSDGQVWTTASVNLRKGAGTDYSVIRTVPEGVRLTYDKAAKDDRGVTWYRVTYKKRTGWISSRYASKSASSGSASGGSSSASGSKIKTTGSVNLRTGAGLDYNSLCSIPKGTTLSYDETRKDDRGVKWYHVFYDGRSGWVSSKYAKKK